MKLCLQMHLFLCLSSNEFTLGVFQDLVKAFAGYRES